MFSSKFQDFASFYSKKTEILGLDTKTPDIYGDNSCRANPSHAELVKEDICLHYLFEWVNKRVSEWVSRSLIAQIHFLC